MHLINNIKGQFTSPTEFPSRIFPKQFYTPNKAAETSTNRLLDQWGWTLAPLLLHCKWIGSEAMVLNHTNDFRVGILKVFASLTPAYVIDNSSRRSWPYLISRNDVAELLNLRGCQCYIQSLQILLQIFQSLGPYTALPSILQQSLCFLSQGSSGFQAVMQARC